MENALKSVRGFNLIELAIVLAIIGAIVGGIYTNAGAVYEAYKTQRLIGGATVIALNMHELYDGQAAFDGNFDEDNALTADVFPSSMKNAGRPESPFGPVRLEGRGNQSTFTLTLYAIPPGPCVRLLNALGGNLDMINDIRLASARTNGFDVDLPVNTSSVITACTPLQNEVELEFRL